MSQEEFAFLIGTLVGLLAGLAALSAYATSARQLRLSASGIAADWLRDLRAWASEAVDVLSEATYCCPRDLCRLSEREQELVMRSRHRLSALIDRGRFLLPNEREREYGGHKASAFAGLRHPALDALVAAERILCGDIYLLSFPNAKSALIGVRREYVSIVQAILDPRSTNKAVASILKHAQDSRKKDPTFGGLLPDPSKVPEGDEGLLYTAAHRYNSRNAASSGENDKNDLRD